MDVDDEGTMADAESPIPVPQKKKSGPKLKGVPTKRDPKRTELLVLRQSLSVVMCQANQCQS